MWLRCGKLIFELPYLSHTVFIAQAKLMCSSVIFNQTISRHPYWTVSANTSMTTREIYIYLKNEHLEKTAIYLTALGKSKYEDLFDTVKKREISICRSNATIASAALTHFMVFMQDPAQEYKLPDKV